MYLKLTDHLAKAHHLTTKKEREPYMKEAFQKTPDLRVISECILCWHGISLSSVVTVLHAERLGLEGAKSFVPSRKSYPCPFSHCEGKHYPRLADHLTTKHHLKGPGWQRLRHLLLEIAHRLEADNLSDVERGLLSRLPYKVEDYMQSSEVGSYKFY